MALLKSSMRALRLALGEIDRAAVVIGPRVIFLDVDGEAEIIHGFVQPAENAVCQAAAMTGDFIWLSPFGLMATQKQQAAVPAARGT